MERELAVKVSDILLREKGVNIPPEEVTADNLALALRLSSEDKDEHVAFDEFKGETEEIEADSTIAEKRIKVDVEGADEPVWVDVYEEDYRDDYLFSTSPPPEYEGE